MAIASNFPAIKPSLLLDFANTKKLDSRITFTRTTTATYYDGVTTAKAEENLLLQSQDFATTWGNVSTTETVDSVAAPDGTTTADTITATAGLSSHSVFQTVTVPTGTIVVSVFAKAGTHNYIQLFLSTQTGTYANFDLTAGAGATGTSSGVVSTSITSVGNDWYRCVMIFTQSNATAVQIALVSSSSAARADSWTALGTETVYLWGAQLEQRSSVTSYTATTTQAITNYIPVLLTAASGVARFDHNPTTDESLGLLIEEARTNLILQSEDFSTNWTYTNSTITANTVVSPSGALTGDKLIVDNGVAFGSGFTRQNVSKAASAITYTSTIYAKAGEFNRVRCLCRDSTTSANSASVTISLVDGSVVVAAAATGTFTSASSSTTSVGNGWYRISLTFTSGTETTIWGGTYIPSDSVATQGNGYSGIYIWGAQLEAGAFPTSYIATTAATVTRNADFARMTGGNFTSWFNAGEGTIYFEPQSAQGTNSYPYSLFGSSTSNRIFTNYSSNSKMDSGIRINGTFDVLMPTPNNSAPLNTFGKGAAAYKVNDFGFSWNGAAALTDTSTTLPIIQELDIGNNGGLATNWLNGTIKKIAYYPLRLTNAQLQALTS